jgi:predicted RND superfamily exporter protein
MEKPTFFGRRALLILVVVFFLVPFALRGARMAVLGMKNDVKDWLPRELEETKDLEEFRRYFLSEQFVLVSWDGCQGDASDERFKMFLAKLTPETPPTVLAQQAASKQASLVQANGEEVAAPDTANSDAQASAGDDDKFTSPTRYIHRDENFIGDKLGLYFVGNWHENWGDRREKWLRGRKLDGESTNEECWYFLTRDGDLFRWDAVDSPPASLARIVYRWLFGKEVKGTLVHSFGPIDGPWYHDDPRRLRAQLFKTVTTGPDVLASLTQEGGELSGTDELRAEAQRRLSGVLFGPDGKTTCFLLTLTDPARRNLHLVCGRGMLGKPRGRLYEIAAESNIVEGQLHMGGPPIDNVAIDEEGSITLVRLISYSIALGIGLCLICFRSISATIMVFFVGGISAIMSVALVWWCGSSLDAIMMSMPSMIYVLGLSGAAHIMNYYHDAVAHHGYRGAPERAVAQGWKPAFLCEVTTALGLITLITSELVPIRKFGVFSAIAVMVMFGIMLTYLPAALELWPQKKRKPAAAGEDSPWLDNFLTGFWRRFGGFMIDHHALVTIGSTLLIVVVGYGVVYMRTSVNLLKMFHSEAKIIKDYAWLERHLGQLVPMEVVVRVPKADQRPSSTQLAALHDELAASETSAERKAQIEATLHETRFQMPFLERMELAARVQNLIEDEFGPQKRDVVGRAISAATFIRPLPEAGGSTFVQTQRSTISGRLEEHKGNFLHSDYLRISQEDQTELWRISLRIGATKGVDYGAFVSNLQETVEPVIAAQHQRQAILRQLDNYRSQHGAADAPLSSARVLLVGVSATTLAENKRGGNDQAESTGLADAAAKPTILAPVDQNRIFARTLRDLLTVSRLRLETIADAYELPENFDESLARYDCVVVLNDVPQLGLSRIERSARLVMDARDHTFSAAAGQRTVWRREPASVAAVYTGVVPIVYKAQRMLLDSLIQSTFWSVITITPLLMWIARSFSAGAVAMLPNVLPIVMVFGGMGWLGIDVDVGAMMTASIALGVAVDDTIHYLNWFREELDRVGDRKKAILAAYQHCATPTLQAALISGLGLSIFAFSTFTPTQQFGILMLVILWAGAIAELVYFPAILAGPLGMVFKPRKKLAANQETGLDSPESLESRQPQLQIVHHDEPAEEIALVDGAAASQPAQGPHTAGRSGSRRQVRPDAPHRRD